MIRRKKVSEFSNVGFVWLYYLVGWENMGVRVSGSNFETLIEFYIVAPQFGFVPPKPPNFFNHLIHSQE